MLIIELDISGLNSLGHHYNVFISPVKEKKLTIKHLTLGLNVEEMRFHWLVVRLLKILIVIRQHLPEYSVLRVVSIISYLRGVVNILTKLFSQLLALETSIQSGFGKHHG